jgi:hypothetical protein
MALHVRHDANAEPSVFADGAVEVFGLSPAPDVFPERMPVDEAFLQAISYAERAGIAVIWIR